MKSESNKTIVGKYGKIFMKVILGCIIFLIIAIVGVAGYSFVFEKDQIAIDRYNFEQRDKIRMILKDLDREDEKFNNLQEFNTMYDEDIQPIKNCYYVKSFSRNEDRYLFQNNEEDRVLFAFGFQLESSLYRFLYRKNGYMYPKYELPHKLSCTGCERESEGISIIPYRGENCKCFDGNRKTFENTISNPCRDN